MPATTDVLIVGAGPVGLALGVTLRMSGVACRIVDRRDAPTPLAESRALALWSRTLEIFDAMGVIGEVLGQSKRIRAMNAYAGGRRLARIPTELGEGSETNYPFVLSLPQGQTERILIARFEALGGTIDRGRELTGLAQDEHGTHATLEAADGSPETVDAPWLVGGDGARSAVRHQLALSFDGAAYEETFLLIDARVAWSLRDDEAQALYLHGGGVIAGFPLPAPGRWRLIDASGALDGAEPAQIVERFRAVIRENGHPEAVIDDVLWSSAFRIHRRLVDRFRVGRVFVVGDAAHIHSPVGGQGMNTGIQDAFNLGWKLAAVAQGRAPEGLLDTYQAERRPVAESILRGTDLATRLVTVKSPTLTTLRDAAMFAAGHVGAVRRRVVRNLSELEIGYRDSPIVAEDWYAASPGPQPGDRLPDVAWTSADGQGHRLYDQIRGARSTLLLFEGGAGPEDGPFRAILDVLAPFGDSIEPVVVAATDHHLVATATARVIADDARILHHRFGATGPSLYLVRPDGYIGYRAQPPDAGRLASYLGRLYRPAPSPFPVPGEG